MANNQHQLNAKTAKNDEFYTLYHDIEIEVNAHLAFDDAAIYKYLSQADPVGFEVVSRDEKLEFPIIRR